MTHLPSVAQRFMRYVQIDTQSNPASDTVPSTEKQKDLGRLLVEELNDIGIQDVAMNEAGYVFATLPAMGKTGINAPILGLLAHMDTSPDESGKNVKPIIHSNYDGGVIALPGDPSIRLNPETQPALLEHLGHDIITSDGTTLLGSDDKAGVAILMQMAEDLVADTETERPKIRLCFTVDEEIGRGVDHLSLEELGVDVAYTIDGSGVGNFFTETFNAVMATLTVKGVMVHPGYAKGIMVNAVRIMCEIIAALPADQAPESTGDREGYIHPHNIGDGDASRIEATFILRDFSPEGMERKKQYLSSLVDFYQVKYPKAEFNLTLVDQYKNMRSYIENTDPRVVSLAHVAASQMGITLEEHVVRGGTDGARLSELGIPTPNVFNGGYDYHSKFEWNTVQNLETSLIYLKHLVKVWGREI
ncbi:MAG: peptidase T [Rhodothermales bacterium]